MIKLGGNTSIFDKNNLKSLDNDNIRQFRRSLGNFLKNGRNIVLRRNSAGSNTIVAFEEVKQTFDKEEEDEKPPIYNPLTIEDLMEMITLDIENCNKTNREVFVCKDDIYGALDFINKFVALEFTNGEWVKI